LWTTFSLAFSINTSKGKSTHVQLKQGSLHDLQSNLKPWSPFYPTLSYQEQA
jgi:hypothetical protein